MITESEKARRIALGRHAGAFLRALAGERAGIAAMVLRSIAAAVTPVEPEAKPQDDRVIIINNAFVSRGGDA